MNTIFRYAAMTIMLILAGIHVLRLPVEAMTGPEHHVDPVVKLAQTDAKHDIGLGLRWFVYGAGCWMFAVVHAGVSEPTVPSQRLLGKSPHYVKTYTDTYRRSIKNQRLEMSAIGWGISLGATL